MTDTQIIELFGKMHGGTMNGEVTYKEALPISARGPASGSDPNNYYKVVTRKCIGDMSYYNTKMGKDSLASGNTPSIPKGCDGHYKDSNGNEYVYLYTSPKGLRVRLYVSSAYEDTIRYFVNHKEAQYADIEQLVNDGVLLKGALKTYPSNDYMCPYVSTLINVRLIHKHNREVTGIDVGDPSAFQHVNDYHENLK